MKTNLLTWTGLVMLCAASAFARGHAGVLLTAAGLKCGLLGWQFLELRAAHWVWRAMFTILVGSLLAAAALLA